MLSKQDTFDKLLLLGLEFGAIAAFVAVVSV